MANRAQVQSGRHFRVSDSTISGDLQRILRMVKATGLKVSQDFETGAATVTFDRDGRRYVMECSAWKFSEDNLRAIGKTIEALYKAQEYWGTASRSTDKAKMIDPFSVFFNGFALVPDQFQLPSGADWRQVLGMGMQPSVAEIQSAYRALAREYHPDTGGDPETFRRIKAAYDAAMKWSDQHAR